jgi:GT2 family glycosyltransferase
MRTALVIPSIGSDSLQKCLQAVALLEPSPSFRLLVLSGGAECPAEASAFEVVRSTQRLGFAAAVNEGLAHLPDGVEAAAVLNDDAVPTPHWLGALTAAIEANSELAAVQSTIVDSDEEKIDGRGIEFDPWGLPVQIDRGQPLHSDEGQRRLIAVSGTACLYRLEALRQATLPQGGVFDPYFDCYHEDLDLGLRLLRLSWQASWVGGAPVRHLGSASGPTLRWRHPWWVLANRWRALAGNLKTGALLGSLPRLLRGEVRAVRTLGRSNPRVPLVAAAVAISLPALIGRGWLRITSGPRLTSVPVVRG